MQSGNLSITGGNGGTGTSGSAPGNGGVGGNTSLTLGTFSVGVSTDLGFVGGSGGTGGNDTIGGTGGNGGAGGSLAVTMGTLNLGAGSVLNFNGGAGGVGGSATLVGGNGGQGGAGGNVQVSIGAVTLAASNYLDINGGSGGSGGSGNTQGANGAQGQASATIGDLEGLGAVNISGNNPLLAVGQGNYGGSLAGTLTLDKTGPGTLLFSGVNRYSGGTSILGGSLIVDTGGALGSGTVQVNSGTLLAYINSSNASLLTNISISNNAGATLLFMNSSTAGNSNIINNGLVNFLDNSTGGSAQILNNSGGVVDFSYNNASTVAGGPMTVGSIAGNGNYDLGQVDLYTGGNNQSTTVSGIVADGGGNGGTGASLTKVGKGTLTLSGTNTYTGGTFLNGGTLAVGNIQGLGLGLVAVNNGTLSTADAPLTFQVGGNYTQASNGTLQLGLGGAGASLQDYVNITGTAGLSGTLNLASYGSLTAPIGTSVTVLSASSVSGIFQQVDENFSGIRLLPIYLSNGVELESINPSFQNSGLTPNQKAIGADLDTIALKPQFNGVMATIGVLTNTGLQTAYGQLSPEDFTGLYRAGFEQAAARSGLVDQRLSQLMSDVDNTVWLPGFSEFGTPLYAANLPAKKEAAVAPPQESPWGGFISGNGGLFQVTADSNAAGYKVTTYGLTGAGADYRLSREASAGLIIGYGHTDVTPDTGGTLTANGGEIGLYGLVYSEGFYASALAEGGVNNYSTQRQGYNNVTATGSTQGQQYDGALQMGLSFKANKVRLGPFGSLQYTHVSMNGFTEQGSQMPLTMPAQSEDSLLSRLGIKVNSPFSLGEGYALNPSLQLAWEHEYNDQGGSLEAGFGTGDSFTVAGPQVGQDGLSTAVGVEFSSAYTCIISLQYQGEFGRTNLNSSQLGGGLKFGF
jgi:autotransporter-associated beta strand protein